jgi:hypothetical protein
MSGLYHPPFGTKIKTGYVETGHNGSSFRATGVWLSVFNESGNGGSSALISATKDEAGIITAAADMSGTDTYITVPDNADLIRFYAGAYWNATSSQVGAYNLEIAEWTAGAGMSRILLNPGHTMIENVSGTGAGGADGSNVHLTVDSGLQRVSSTDLIQAGMKICPFCYQGTGGNLTLASNLPRYNYFSYEMFLK